nr:hypothetical protein BaRGS_017119 [Batillaria attramentaria]
MHQISAVENPAHRLDDFYDDKLDSQDQWYDDLEGLGDPPDAGEMSNRGRKRIEKDPNPEDKEKPYVCEVPSGDVFEQTGALALYSEINILFHLHLYINGG